MNGEANDRPEKLKVKLVPLTEEHMEAVMEIERDLFTQPWRVEDFKRLIGKTEAINLAALAEKKVVGYSCCWVVIETAELGNIAVARQYQGRSVARALLEATVKACRKRKFDAMLALATARHSSFSRDSASTASCTPPWSSLSLMPYTCSQKRVFGLGLSLKMPPTANPLRLK